jgi:predicted O-methyltransferase YrrM
MSLLNYKYINVINIWEKYIEKNLFNLINDPLEGNFYSSHLKKTKEPSMVYKQKNIINFIESFKPKNILEIGFNAGFSTLLMKIIDPEINMTCIDINSHSYVMPCYKQICKDYKNIKLILQNSTIALPELIKMKLKFDVIHIDGDHNVKQAEQDLNFCLSLCSSKSVIIIDDTNLQSINDLCEKYIDEKFLKEHVFSKVECKKYKHRFLEVL